MRAKIEDEVDVVDVFEVAYQPDQVLVLQQLLDLDFTLELELSVVCMLSLTGVRGSEVLLVDDLDQSVQNLLRIVNTEHLRQFDQVVALDAAVAESLVVRRRVSRVVLLDHRIGLKNVVREALGIVFVQRDETVSLQDV